MSPVAETPAHMRTEAKWDDLRHEFTEILGIDRWVDASYPAIAPVDSQELSCLLRHWSGPVFVVGSGSDYPDEFQPPVNMLAVLTTRMSVRLDINDSDQVVEVDAGYEVAEVNARLSAQGYVVPALMRFERGTIGGRLASMSSRPTVRRADGWIQSLLSLDVALPDGREIQLGGRCIKDVAGYDLRHVFTGSKGCIGVITSAGFRCLSMTLYRQSETPLQLTQTYFDSFWRRIFDPNERMGSGV